MYNSKILYNALKLCENIYDESQYGVDDLYRIKDLSHSLDINHWLSKQWLVDKLYPLYSHDCGKALIVGGWYGLTAYLMRQKWKDPCMNIVSSDMDPICQDFGYVLFEDQDLQFETIKVDDKLDLSEYSIIINTSCEHMEQKDVKYLIDNKPKDTWIALQSNDYYDLDSHINCSPSLLFWKDELFPKHIDWVAYEGTQSTPNFNRFMIIGK